VIHEDRPASPSPSPRERRRERLLLAHLPRLARHHAHRCVHAFLEDPAPMPRPNDGAMPFGQGGPRVAAF